MWPSNFHSSFRLSGLESTIKLAQIDWTLGLVFTSHCQSLSCVKAMVILFNLSDI